LLLLNVSNFFDCFCSIRYIRFITPKTKTKAYMADTIRRQYRRLVRLITCRFYINADWSSCIQRPAHNVSASSALNIRQLPPNRHCNLCVVQSCNITRHPTSSITGYLNGRRARLSSLSLSSSGAPRHPLRHCGGCCVRRPRGDTFQHFLSAIFVLLLIVFITYI